MPDPTRALNWWNGMIARHGSEAAVREFMRQASHQSARNTGAGGFAALDKARVRELGRKGGIKSGEVRRAKRLSNPL